MRLSKNSKNQAENRVVTITGGGPIGSHAAMHLAKKGHSVTVLEEHSEIGKPVQCTGIVTQSIKEVTQMRKEFVVNRLRKVRVHAPDGSSACVKVKDIVIDRTKFDQHIAEKAKKAGAVILNNNRVAGVRANGKKIRVNNLKKKTAKIKETDILVGADGPQSIVSQHLGNKFSHWIGVQATVNMPVDKDTYSVYFGKEIPGFFGWIVPEDSGIARVGIATQKNPRTVFNKFMKRFGKHKIVRMQGGLIPIYDSHICVQKKDVYVVGDAAGQVKATTGGGLVPGMKAAEALADSINHGTSYKSALRNVNKELKMSMMLRSILNRFNDKDYNTLVDIVGAEKIRKILNKESRDKPSRIVFKSVIKEPKLLLFARTLLRAKRL